MEAVEFRKMDRYTGHIRKIILRSNLSLADIEGVSKRSLYETLEGQRRMEITSGVAQRFILGPDLWNVFTIVCCDSICPKSHACYVDDFATLFAGSTVDQAHNRFGILMRGVSGWMTAHGSSPALEKSEETILSRSRIPTLHRISIDEFTTESKPAGNYLDSMIDSKKSFFALESLL